MSKTDKEQLETPLEPRKPYERPGIMAEEVFETMALSCGQANPLVCPDGLPSKS